MGDNLTFFVEFAVILACIVMGTRVGGAGVGLWGGVGVFILVFVFGEAPGAPPASAVAIILAVVTAAALMQASGGIDWMVKIAAGIIEAHPGAHDDAREDDRELDEEAEVVAHRLVDGPAHGVLVFLARVGHDGLQPGRERGDDVVERHGGLVGLVEDLLR